MLRKIQVISETSGFSNTGTDGSLKFNSLNFKERNNLYIITDDLLVAIQNEIKIHYQKYVDLCDENISKTKHKELKRRLNKLYKSTEFEWIEVPVIDPAISDEKRYIQRDHIPRRSKLGI